MMFKNIPLSLLLLGAAISTTIALAAQEENVCSEDEKTGCDRVPSGTIVITGANKGIGLETVILLARGQHFAKYILTVRSAKKGDSAIRLASEASSQPASLFSYIVMDLENTASVVDAVAKLPSNINALGVVKFMFPNEFNIYMHDTPMKELFFKDERTFSHGCVRVQDPFQFAFNLLGYQDLEPEKKFQTILLRKNLQLEHRLLLHPQHC